MWKVNGIGTSRQVMGNDGSSCGYWGINVDGFYEIYHATTIVGSTAKFDLMKHKLFQNNSILFNNDEQILIVPNCYEWVDNTYKIFATQNASSNKMKAKINKVKMWDNNILVRDMVPVYKKSNNEAGMYDLVSNEFYGNASGSGAFTHGNDVLTKIRVSKNLINNIGSYPTTTYQTNKNVYVWLKKGTYTISINTSNASKRLKYFLAYKDGSIVGPDHLINTGHAVYYHGNNGYLWGADNTSDTDTITIDDDYYFAFACWNCVNKTTNNIQLEVGSTATTYEPYGIIEVNN